MGEGQLSGDMKTIVAASVEQEPSLDLLQEAIEQKPKKPRSVTNVTDIKPLLEFSDLPNVQEISKPQPASSDVISKNDIKKKEKKALEKVLIELDEIRLNLTDSNGHGFLMNASAIISSPFSFVSYRA